MAYPSQALTPGLSLSGILEPKIHDFLLARVR